MSDYVNTYPPVRADTRSNGNRPDPITDPVETATPGFIVDVSKWKMREYMTWTKAGKSGDIESMNIIAVTVICRWPYAYAGSPSDPEAYLELEPVDWKIAMRSVEDACIARFQSSEETPISR